MNQEVDEIEIKLKKDSKVTKFRGSVKQTEKGKHFQAELVQKRPRRGEASSQKPKSRSGSNQKTQKPPNRSELPKAARSHVPGRNGPRSHIPKRNRASAFVNRGQKATSVRESTLKRREKEIMDEETGDTYFYADMNKTIKEESILKKNIEAKLIEANRTENQKKRKWKMIFREFQLINTGDTTNAFMVVSIGYNLEKRGVRSAAGAMEERLVGDRGIQYISDLQMSIERDIRRKFAFSLSRRYSASFDDLRNTYLYIQIWKYNSWTVNELLGMAKINLLSLTNGSNMRNEGLSFRQGGKVIENFRLSFFVLFEEIWNFQFQINEIFLSNYYPRNQKSKISVALKFKGSTKTSKKQDASSAMFFSEIKGHFKFKGILTELRNSNVILKVKENGKTIMDKAISLMNIGQNSKFETVIKIEGAESELEKELEDIRPDLWDMEDESMSLKNNNQNSENENSEEQIEINKLNWMEARAKIKKDTIPNFVYCYSRGVLVMKNGLQGLPRYQHSSTTVLYEKQYYYLGVS